MNIVRFISSKAFLFSLLIAIGFIIALIFGTQSWLKSSTNHEQRIEVPDLHRMTLNLVEQELNSKDLRFTVIDSANFNPDYPKYSVIEQTPEPGKYVKEKRKIYLVLNPSDYSKITIPNVIDRTRRQAEPKLIALGFKIGKISYVPWIGKDEVRELRHEGKKITPGDKLPKTSVIDLVLGDGNR